MTNNETLRELKNEVEIVGTLKSKEIEMRTSKRTGKDFVTGKLVVLVEEEDKVHEIPVSVFCMKSSKLYKGIETVSKEYKSIEEVGKENADRIKVSGNLTLNEYQNREGRLVQFNDVQGVFYNRIDNDEIKDEATGNVIKGNTYAVRSVDENGEVYECTIKPFRVSDKMLLNMLMR